MSFFGDIADNVSEAVDNTKEAVSNINAGDLLEDFGQTAMDTGHEDNGVLTGNSLDFGDIWARMSDKSVFEPLDTEERETLSDMLDYSMQNPRIMMKPEMQEMLGELLSPEGRQEAAEEAAFPDVCLTPTPFGPVPIPYPNIALLSEKAGSVKFDQFSDLGGILGHQETNGQWDELMSGIEENLSTLGDDAQLANIEMQNQLQKQQQVLQTISNVSKMLHDTGMSIIKKIG